MNVVYTTDVTGLTAADLEGFFADWPVPPTPDRHLEMLRGSDHVVLARDGEGGRVDLVCDPELVPFYRRFELMLLSGMSQRRPQLLRP